MNRKYIDRELSIYNEIAKEPKDSRAITQSNIVTYYEHFYDYEFLNIVIEFAKVNINISSKNCLIINFITKKEW